MRIAVAYENGEIYQHFGHTEQFKAYDVQDGKVKESRIVDTNGQGHGALQRVFRVYKNLSRYSRRCGGLITYNIKF